MLSSLNNLQPWGACFMRLVLGCAMFYHGWDKVIPHGGPHAHNLLGPAEHFAGYVSGLGLSYWLGYLSAFAEFVGGACLVLGFLTRFFALLITGNMLVAIVLVNRHHGYTASEYSLALLALALMLLFYGGGRLALDRKMGFN